MATMGLWMITTVPHVINLVVNVMEMLLICVQLAQLWIQPHTISNMELIAALTNAQKVSMLTAHLENAYLVIVTAKLVKISPINV